MKVSIITCTYNSAATIADTIRSVNAQTYPNIEHIIVDGLSKDNTLEIVKQYAGERQIIKSEKDNGIYDAFNKGIRMATGDIIGVLNSDDFFTSDNIIEQVVNAFNKENIGPGNPVPFSPFPIDPLDPAMSLTIWKNQSVNPMANLLGKFSPIKALFGTSNAIYAPCRSVPTTFPENCVNNENINPIGVGWCEKSLI